MTQHERLRIMDIIDQFRNNNDIDIYYMIELPGIYSHILEPEIILGWTGSTLASIIGLRYDVQMIYTQYIDCPEGRIYLIDFEEKFNEEFSNDKKKILEIASKYYKLYDTLKFNSSKNNFRILKKLDELEDELRTICKKSSLPIELDEYKLETLFPSSSIDILYEGLELLSIHYNSDENFKKKYIFSEFGAPLLP